MPHMSPINWLLLFIIFTMNISLFNITNYYSGILKTPKSHQLNTMQNYSMNWKW